MPIWTVVLQTVLVGWLVEHTKQKNRGDICPCCCVFWLLNGLGNVSDGAVWNGILGEHQGGSRDLFKLTSFESY